MRIWNAFLLPTEWLFKSLCLMFPPELLLAGCLSYLCVNPKDSIACEKPRRSALLSITQPGTNIHATVKLLTSHLFSFISMFGVGLDLYLYSSMTGYLHGWAGDCDVNLSHRCPLYDHWLYTSPYLCICRIMSVVIKGWCRLHKALRTPCDANLTL